MKYKLESLVMGGHKATGISESQRPKPDFIDYDDCSAGSDIKKARSA